MRVTLAKARVNWRIFSGGFIGDSACTEPFDSTYAPHPVETDSKAMVIYQISSKFDSNCQTRT